MNAKQLVVLAVLAAISVAATAAVLRTGAPTVASDRRGESVVPSLMAKANDITALSVREGAGIPLEDLGFEEQWLVVDLLLSEDVPTLPNHAIHYCDPARPHTAIPRGARERGTSSKAAEASARFR